LTAAPEEQAIIDRMREWRAGGWTLRQVADELNATSTPTKRSAGKWHPQTVKNILGNSLYGEAA
jgi:hypothetical protein